MSELSGQEDKNRDLRELSDPEFFTYWAFVRCHLVQTPKSKPEYLEIKRRYNALVAEYRRRIEGGLTLAGAER